MIKFSRIIISVMAAIALSSCSQIVQPIELQVNTKDVSEQEEFQVVEKTLTIKEARKQNLTTFKRFVLQAGKGKNAKLLPERVVLVSNFPKIKEPFKYKIGIKDVISFSRLVENNRFEENVETRWPKENSNFNYNLGVGDTLELTLLREQSSISKFTPTENEDDQNIVLNSQSDDKVINSSGRVGSDGSVLLLEVGRLEASGKTLNELRSEVRNILIRNGVSPRFQLEIKNFQSQRAYLTINSQSKVVLLDDLETTLRDILTSADVGFRTGVVTHVTIQRDGKKYTQTLRKIFSKEAPKIRIKAQDHIFVEDSFAEIKTTTSTVDHEGNIVFPSVGKIYALGKTIEEVRSDISSLMEKLPDSQNDFQVKIAEFNSQKAIVSIPGKPGGVIKIHDTAIPLDEILTEMGMAIDVNMITQINLRRGGKSFFFTLDELLKETKDRLYLNPDDQVSIQTLKYKNSKVFILGGITPQIFEIDPSVRQTLADILFTSGGALSKSSAKRSEVYLLRGSNPVMAYHLDAQNPTRLIVADAMELRPNDILYVAEQPIISFNRTLATIVPLRILLRDIQDENIP